jgi:hypothetical protein
MSLSIDVEEAEQRVTKGNYPAEALKRRRERRDRLNALRRLVIICAWCKKIRASDGVWQLPTDLQAHDDSKLSHGICPECAGLVGTPTS